MNIRDIKYKINILFNINKLTNTMSMISFSKLTKFDKNYKILNNLYLETKNIFLEIYNYKKKKNFCIILITTNKGYCGNINNEIYKNFFKLIKNNNNLDIILIGKKGIDFFSKKNIFFKNKFFFNEKDNIIFNEKNLQDLKQYENIFFLSTKFINNEFKTIKTNFYEKKKKNFFEKFLNFNEIFSKYFNYTFKYLYNQNYLCELKLRMITMKSAADNSKKIIKFMHILKNKIRQYKVTQEMLEIINGIL
uniref:ATP synthase gamma subunit n=1 Tax=Carsonella ruddii TaxID=114186 RepID=Q93UD7_CARRU|nr:ATP synthase gamma subunit [Candidatus Carsonella ruddii]